ncbi:iron-siderophore ABC transporter substrate-binding protein [filamentous cyanobacterium CCT1]|nr:iron-siderophore ABC transporter substrate-binding protein [filamentous cyanobacterium CCT1]PSN76979.1 iron-siderophore ABC transporter substrate-binding protein [filamentous cyanobacterium CCP4]
MKQSKDRKILRQLNQWLLLPLLSVLTLLILISCSEEKIQVGTHEANQGVSTVECHMVQHASGEVCVPGNPQRVITLGRPSLGNALALGVKPIGSSYDLERGNEFSPYLKDKTSGIEPVGDQNQPSLETLVLLKPDLIVSWQPIEDVYPRLSEIAPTTPYNWDGKDNWDSDKQPKGIWRDYFNFMAEVLNKEEAKQQAWNQYYQRIEELKSALGNRYQNKSISLVNFCCGEIFSDVKNSFPGSILDDVGLKRPEAQNINAPLGFIRFSEETFEKADGDVLFVYSSYDGEEHFQRLKGNPLWSKLKAVQQNHVYFVDVSAWRNSDMRAAHAVIDDLYKYLVDTP